MIVKVLKIPSKLPKHNLPNHIVKHCNRYKEERLKQASLFAWIKLSKYIDVAKVKFSKNGKPYLIDNKKYFSLSHSFNLIAIAIDNKPIGIDIEMLLPSNIASMLANRLLSGSKLIAYYKAKDREVWFTKYWTKYEAFCKLKDKPFNFNCFKHRLNGKFNSKQIKNNGRIFILTVVS